MSTSFKYTTSIVFLICIAQICFHTQRHEFAILIATYAVFFIVYLAVLTKTKTDTDLNFFIKIGFLLRGVAVFSFPNLSDDIYRFLWDGHLVNLGENPFSHPPQYYFDNHLFSERLTPELFSKINSPKYYSVYPTVSQAVFAFATFLFPKSIYGGAIVVKLFLFACEVGTILLMRKLTFRWLCPNLPQERKTFGRFETFRRLCPNIAPNVTPLIYALNPLVIIELIGNCHFEAAMIFFFILAVYWVKNTEGVSRYSEEVTSSHPLTRYQSSPTTLQQTQPITLRHLYICALFFSLSVVSKMLPLMFLPLLLKHWGWKRSFYFWTMVGFSTLIFLLPLYSDLFFKNIGTSLTLYFNNFEFNASLFYVLKSIGLYIYGYDMINQITPFLTAIVLFFIIKESFVHTIFGRLELEKRTIFGSFKTFRRLKPRLEPTKGTFLNDCLMVISVYFACATTVHPWYAAFPLALCVFTTWRFPVVWTFFILLTYGNYTEGSSTHNGNLGLIIVEYVVVYAFFIFEWYMKRRRQILMP
jgi:alpha-1,6-mannosyltransferase